MKADVRGKCFIEYLPAEQAWVPVEASGYMYINCLWVSGKLKGQGYSNILLEECICDSKAKGKRGLVILSSKKKMPYLADKKYLQYKGFLPADQMEPYFELWYLPFENTKENEKQIIPHFRRQSDDLGVTMDDVNDSQGFVLFYTHQCPFTAKYVPLLEQYAKEKGVELRSILIDSCEKAQNVPVPFTTYALFHNGTFVTHEILSVKKFEDIVQQLL